MLSIKTPTTNRTNELVRANRLTILREKYLNPLLALGRDIKKLVRYCAAKLLDYFQHWAEWKTETHRTEWIYQPLREIRKDLLGEYSIHVIREAIAFLIEEGYLERRKNPGNGQDRTYQYRLVKTPSQNPSTETHTQSPFVRSESANVKPEPCRVNVDKYHSFQSIESIPTAAVVAVDLKIEEGSDKEVDRYQQDSLNDIQKAQEDALNHLEVVDNIKEESKVIAGISDEDHSSPAARVNSFQSEPETPVAMNDVVSEVESLVGDEMNPQLKRFILSQSVAVVKEAIAFVKEKLAKGQTVKKKAGYLVTAIRNQFKPTPSTAAVQSQKFPAGFEEWYAEATEKGQVENRELRHLSISSGQPMVFVPDLGRSMVWYEAQALLTEADDVITVTELLEEDYPVEIPKVGSWVKFQDLAWKVEKIEGDLVQTLNLWDPALDRRVEGILPLQLSP